MIKKKMCKNEKKKVKKVRPVGRFAHDPSKGNLSLGHPLKLI
jgi:hypothetical protein